MSLLDELVKQCSLPLADLVVSAWFQGSLVISNTLKRVAMHTYATSTYVKRRCLLLCLALVVFLLGNFCVVVTDLGSINYLNDEGCITPLAEVNSIKGLLVGYQNFSSVFAPPQSSVHLAFLMARRQSNCPLSVFARSLSTHSSSETLRGDIANKLSHIKHKKPTSSKELGSYLAGLFEGDGYISNIPQIVIVFHQKDKQSAITLRDSFEHGNIKPVSRKKAVVWVISDKSGIIKFLNLVNGFIRTPYKLNQILTNAGRCLPSNFQKEIDGNHLLKSWWLSGFTDADGYLYTQILSNRKPSDTVRIQLKFSLKDRILLDQLASTIGSTVGIRQHANGTISYYWSSGTNKNAFKIYAYFHKYSLQSKKWLEFMYWRKSLRLVFENNPLMNSHLNQIKSYKLSMEKLRI